MKYLFILASIAAALMADNAQAAEKADVDIVIELVAGASKSKAMLRYERRAGWLEAEFDVGDTRYVILYEYPYHERSPRGVAVMIRDTIFAVLVRPRSAKNERETDLLVDKGADGSIDMGLLGFHDTRPGEEPERKKFLVDSAQCVIDPKLCGPFGLEFKPYWQARYDKILKDIGAAPLKR
jgi:hypothetical protein